MIKKIKWNNHEILGNLELDFSKTDGSVYNTIILAGENGTGKTTILESIASFLNFGSVEPFEYINYMIDNTSYRISKPNSPKLNPNHGFHSRKNENTGTTKDIFYVTADIKNGSINDLEDIRQHGFVYSKARSGFNTKIVNSTTTQQLDEDKYEIDASDDFTSLKQLIVDVSSQDNAEWMKITKSGEDTDFIDFKKNSRMFRFEEAFNNFFDNIKFYGVNESNSKEKQILFEKYKKYVPVDELSTGEKQIVFRGIHLLKNINSLSSGIALIDEPELSMHPKWQQKILNYYRSLFTKDEEQNVQIFIATHSEYVLRSALEDRENVLIITLNNDNGIINSNRITAPTILPTITAAETNYLAFGIVSSDYHIELYGYLQNKKQLTTVKACDDYIVSQTSLYNPNLHSKPSKYRNTKYESLPTYIRNAIDHPSSTNTYTLEELSLSIELLIELCK